MPDFRIFIFVALAALVFLPIVWTWRTVWFLWRHRQPADVETVFPTAAIILSVRGADPSLRRCLKGVLRQDYPGYRVRIVVDCREDPAWGMIEEVLAEGYDAQVDVQVAVLKRRCETCSLKVSAQLQAIADLGASVEVAAFIDADSIPAANWLQAMVQPFADPKVGVTSGFRWFAPPDSHWGSLVRHMYNAGSLPQMYVYEMAWGGSMALRTKVFRDSNLLEVWSRSFCEDVGSYCVLRDYGFQMAFVPAATHINAESVDLKSCYGFLVRQILCVRLHHYDWWRILTLNVANSIALALMVGLLGVSFRESAWGWFALSGGMIGVYLVGMLSGLKLGETLIRSIVRTHRTDVPPVNVSWKTIPAMLLTQTLSLHCLLATIFLHRVDWRGITYAINGQEKVRLLEYRPFRSQPLDPSRSVV